MFGFQGGENSDLVARKKGYMKEAQKKWPFLTNFDCSTITTPGQLISMIHVRSSISEQQATLDVNDWMEGKEFRSVTSA